MNRPDDEQFYKLLRLSLGLSQEFPVGIDAEAWRRLYQMAVRQTLVGVCNQGMCLLPWSELNSWKRAVMSCLGR